MSTHTFNDAHLQAEYQRLADPPLPVVDADHGVDLEGFDENFVHGLLSAIRAGAGLANHESRTACTGSKDAMSQRGVTCTPGPSCWPACRRRAPAKAIIAPLSVHSDGRGKQARPPRAAAISCRRARRRRLAPTPPDTTITSLPAASSARSHLIASVS